MPKVIHCQKDKGLQPFVYVGRKSDEAMHFGNPFATKRSKIACHSAPTHGQSVARFALWLFSIAYHDVEPKRRQWILDHKHLLTGQDLGCFCKSDHRLHPNDNSSCHGDVLLSWANLEPVKIPETEISVNESGRLTRNVLKDSMDTLMSDPPPWEVDQPAVSVMYAVGKISKKDDQWRFFDGPNPKLSSMKESVGDKGHYIVKLSGDKVKKLYRWSESKQDWKKRSKKK